MPLNDDRSPHGAPEHSDGFDLFNLPPEADITPEEWAALSTPEKFERFHRANPGVYDTIVQKAREWRAAGNGKLGMSLLFGMVRWVIALETKGDPMKVNDHYLPYYSRLVMLREPDLEDLFNLRRSEEADTWIALKRHGRVA